VGAALVVESVAASVVVVVVPLPLNLLKPA